MKRLMKKTFPFLLLISSLVVVYLHDSNVATPKNYLYSDSNVNGSSAFNIQNNDVIVFLDIPGSGMESFSQSLVKDLITETPCKCEKDKTRCSCKNKDKNPWLFQSYNSTGYVCGEHADWTTLTKCPIDQWMSNVGHDSRRVRRYWMLSLIREPLARFVQEWHHLVTMDAYFRNEPRLFRKESVELQKKGLPCLVGKRIAKLTLQEFLDCENNPAVNRITRMLANATQVESLGYKGDKYKSALLTSALENLDQLPFFGISEKPKETQVLLEATLGLRFSRQLDFLPTNVHKPISEFEIPANLIRSIRLANNLDVRLYDHALQLFDRQLEDIKKAFPSIDAQKRSEADTNEDGNSQEYNDDKEDDYNDDSEEENDDEEEDDEYKKYDERHERKMFIDESVLDFSGKDTGDSEEKQIKSSDVDKTDSRRFGDSVKGSRKRSSADEKDDDDVDIANDYETNSNKMKVADDYTEDDSENLRDENLDLDYEESRKNFNSKNVNDAINHKLDNVIQKKEIGSKIRQSFVNLNNGIKNTEISKNDDTTTRDISHDDVSKTEISKDTEDVNEFFNMLAESKRKQQNKQEQERPLRQEVAQSKDNPKQEIHIRPNIVGTKDLNKQTSQKKIYASSPLIGSSGVMATGHPSLIFKPRNQQNQKRHYEMPITPPKTTQPPKLEFKPRLLRNDGLSPIRGDHQHALLPKPSFFPLGWNRLKDGGRIEMPLEKRTATQ